MKNSIKQTLAAGFCLLLLCFASHAQKKSKAPARPQDDPVGLGVLNGPGKVGVFVVKSAAKVAWGTTKFVAKDVAVPVATSLVKPVATHAGPVAAKYILKKSVKYLLPLAVKLSIL